MGLPGGQPTIRQAARTVGGWAWAERALYEVVGRWVASCQAPPLKVYLDTASQHHAWRAQLWREQLGGRLVQAYGGPGPRPYDVEQPFSEAVSRLLDRLCSLTGDVERAAAHNRVVLARLTCEYRSWQERLSPVADRPLDRVAGFALADAAADWAQGAAVLAELMGEGDVDGAAGACAEVERLVAGRGPVFGG